MTDNNQYGTALDAALNEVAEDGTAYERGAVIFDQYLGRHGGDEVDRAIKNALFVATSDVESYERGYDTFWGVVDGNNKFSLSSMFGGVKSRVGNSAGKGSRKLH